MFTSIQFNNFLSPQGSIYLNGIAGGGGGGPQSGEKKMPLDINK